MQPLNRTQILVAMAVTALILLMVATLWRRLGAVTLLPWQITWQSLLLGVAVGLGITATSALIYQIWAAYRASADIYLKLVLKPLLLPDLVWLGLLPGLSEELLFRGVMLPALGGNILALVLSSVCFGVLHLSSPSQWTYAIWATIVGLGLGFSALESNNLMVPIIAHITANLVSSYVWKLNNPEPVN